MAEPAVGTHGFFTIDERRALEKMREFQLANPLHYILNLVQAGVALGATAIDIDAHTHRITLSLKGVTLPAEFHTNPLYGLFIPAAREDLDGYRELAIGLNAVLGLSGVRCEMRSASLDMQLRGRNQPLMGAAETTADTRIVIHRRRHWHTWIRGASPIPEIQVLATRALYCPIPVVLNGTPLQSPLISRPALYRQPGIDMWLGDTPGLVRFVKHGVHICDRVLTLRTPAANALVHADRLLKNVSGTDIVEDERYLETLSDLDRACGHWLNLICDRYTAATPTEQAKLRPQLLQALAAEPLSRLSQRLLAVPVFDTLGGYSVSARDLQQHIEEHRVLLYFEGKPPKTRSPMTIVRIRERWDLVALQNLFGRSLKAADEELGRLGERDHVEQRRKANSKSVTLPPGTYLITVSFEEKGFVGELGILRGEESDVVVTFFRKNRRLAERRFAGQSVAYRLCIQSADLTPDLEGGDMVEDDAYRAALTRGSLVLGEACRRLATTVRSPDPDAARVRQILIGWLTGPYRPGKVEQLSALLREYPLLPTVASGLASLLDLQRDAAEFGSVFYTADLTAGYQKDHRHIVLGHLAVLKSLFPHVTDYSSQLREERRVVAGAPSAAALRGLALYPVAFDGGVVGVAIADRTESTIRFLRSGKPVETQAVALEFGPLEAIVDMGEQGLGAAVDALKGGCIVLAIEIARVWSATSDTERQRLRKFLLSYMSWKSPALPEALWDVPVFPGVGGGKLSLRAWQGFPTLPYIEQDTGTVAIDSAVLVGTPDEAGFVARLAGLQRAERWDLPLARERFMQRPTDLCPPPEECLFCYREAGIAIAFLSPATPCDGTSRMRIRWHERVIETVFVPTPVPLDIVVADDEQVPRADFSGVQRGKYYQALLERLSSVLEAAIGPLSVSAASPDSVLRWAFSKYPSPAALSQAAGGFPLLFDSTGEAMTLQQVAAQVMSRRHCYYVSPGIEGRPLDPSLRLVRLSPHQRAWMEPVFKSMIDYTGALAEEMRERQNASQPRFSTLELGVPTLIKVPVGTAGQLGISVDGSKGVHLLVDSVLVETCPLFGDLPVVGVVSKGADDAGWPLPLMDECLDTLYERVAPLYPHLLLPWFHYRYHGLAGATADQLRGPARLPYFDSGQGPVSLATLFDRVARGDTVWYSPTPRPDRFCLTPDAATLSLLQGLLGLGLQKAPVATLQDMVHVETARAPRPSWWTWLERLWQFLQRPLSAADVEGTETVLESLRSCLRACPQRHALRLSDALLDGIRWGDTGELVRADGGTIVIINRRHPLMRHLSKTGAPVTVLAAAVYSALRPTFPELTDRDEISFLLYLANL